MEIVRAEPQRRRRVCELAERLRATLRKAGLDPLASIGPIVPVVLGEARKALVTSKTMLDAGFLVPAIRPPTVPPGTSRLRISLCAAHEEADIDALAENLVRLRER
jgi:8-amino-7-oxononanoate synthase